MAIPAKKPFFVIIPGASQNPAHYGYLSHLLQLAGYPVFSGLLPSVGSSTGTTVEEDTTYVRDKLVLPVLDHEEADVIIVTHSYSSVPGSAAIAGLSKAERAKQGKKTGVLGQVMIAAILQKGGEGKDIVGAFGGQYPPHIRPDPENNLLRCDDRIGPLYADVPPALAATVAISAMAQGLASFTSPIPAASWWTPEYEGRIAFIRTLNDAAIPLPVQQMMIEGSGAKWIVKDVASGHSPQIAAPEELKGLLVELAEGWEKL